MPPAAPTGAALYARLRAMFPGLSEEDIAHELGTTAKDVQRLKTLGPTGQKLVGLLWVVGWLDINRSLPKKQQDERVLLYSDFRRRQRKER